MPNSSPPPQDHCPSWAVSLILQLRDLETKLGHLPEDGPWSEKTLDTLVARAEDPDRDVTGDEEATEVLFSRLCKGLAHEGYTDEMIALFINSRLTGDRRLAYCSAAEVKAVRQGST